MKIILAFDSFKGTLSALESCDIAESVIKKHFPDARILKIPMADGGEGTAETLASVNSGTMIEVQNIQGPAPKMLLTAQYGLLNHHQTAIIEMASASGLPLIKREERNPLIMTTFGTGQLMKDAMNRGVRKILLGLGGSATVDGGTGAAAALGWKFFDSYGEELYPNGENLQKIYRISAGKIHMPEVQILCDVENPLCGENGAAKIFGPQKGASLDDVFILEDGLFNLAQVIKKDFGIDVLNMKGGGAAGGFGAGAVAFFQGSLISGIEAILKETQLEEKLVDADLIITGEGCLDKTSFQGKVVSGIRNCAVRKNCKIAVVAGRVKVREDFLRTQHIDFAEALADNAISDKEAFADSAKRLEQAIEKLLMKI